MEAHASYAVLLAQVYRPAALLVRVLSSITVSIALPLLTLPTITLHHPLAQQGVPFKKILTTELVLHALAFWAATT